MTPIVLLSEALCCMGAEVLRQSDGTAMGAGVEVRFEMGSCSAEQMEPVTAVLNVLCFEWEGIVRVYGAPLAEEVDPLKWECAAWAEIAECGLDAGTLIRLAVLSQYRAVAEAGERRFKVPASELKCELRVRRIDMRKVSSCSGVLEALSARLLLDDWREAVKWIGVETDDEQ